MSGTKETEAFVDVAEMAYDLSAELAGAPDNPLFQGLNLNLQSHVDRNVALRLLLRGKDENYFVNIVEGLHELYEENKGEDPETADTLLNLTDDVMNIGTEYFGIDWS